MSETKPTPTPWAVASDRLTIDAAPSASSTTGNRLRIAVCGDRFHAIQPNPVQGPANAAFIVRAVNAHDDLLEVAEAIDALMGLTLKRTYPDLAQMLTAAIAKAKGEAR